MHGNAALLARVVVFASLGATSLAAFFNSYATKCAAAEDAPGGPTCLQADKPVGICCDSLDASSDGKGCLTLKGIPNAEAGPNVNTCLRNNGRRAYCCERLNVGSVAVQSEYKVCQGNRNGYCCANATTSDQNLLYGLDCLTVFYPQSNPDGTSPFQCPATRSTYICG